MPFRFRAAISLVILDLLVAVLPAAAQTKIATVVKFNPPLDFTIPAGASSNIAAWSWQFAGRPESAWLIVHFQKFDTPMNPAKALAGGRVEFWHQNGLVTAPYDGIGPDRLLTDDGFWSDTIPGNSLVVAGYGDPNKPIHVVIDRFAYADPPPAQTRAQCLFDIMCLQEGDPAREYSHAVARLRIEFEDEIDKCTGFLFQLPDEERPPKNRIMTASHCFPFNNPKTITAEFNADRSACTQPPGDPSCTGTSYAGQKTTVREHYRCDLAYFFTNGEPGTQTEMFVLSNTAGMDNTTELFMPQHPSGRCKEYSEDKYVQNCNDCHFELKCCGESGSSGAPVVLVQSVAQCKGIYRGDFNANSGAATKADRAIDAFTGKKNRNDKWVKLGANRQPMDAECP